MRRRCRAFQAQFPNAFWVVFFDRGTGTPVARPRASAPGWGFSMDIEVSAGFLEWVGAISTGLIGLQFASVVKGVVQ